LFSSAALTGSGKAVHRFGSKSINLEEVNTTRRSVQVPPHCQAAPAADVGRPRGATIQDVARLAGTSAATVSNLVNGRHSRLSGETGARIEAAIEQLGWRPNHAARQLKVGNARMIGLLVPSVDNPFHGAFALLAEAAAMRRGYHIVLCNSLRDAARERQYAEALWSMGVRGMITSSSPLAFDHLAELQDRGLHLVAFDRGTDVSDGLAPDAVSMDNREAGRLATEHLRQRGHRRIAFVSGHVNSLNRAERVAGWRAALDGEGEALLWRGGSGEAEGPAQGRLAARELLRLPSPPTALVAVNDMHALGIYAGVRDCGLDIPHDVSVVGIDDIALAEIACPPLTTVRQKLAEITEAAVDLLVSRLNGDNSPPRALAFPPELIVRASTATPRPS
jgi:DNA-binding LacI/PurR family transcriptional regulator